jgi:prepilin-type processing-associated H-X9-DG protein
MEVFPMTKRRFAFTLFQLLVVLAVLALLFALFLPAIAKIRLAAARTQSQNNMKQLGLACHNYYDANNVFPPGVDAKHFSTVTYLLPYIEQDNVSKQIDMKKPLTDKENLAVAATRIKVFLNPSDEVEQVDKDFGGTNYLFSAGSQYDLKDNDGVFFEKSKIKFPDITDGTSNTMMIGETLKGSGEVPKTAQVARQHVLLKKEDLKNLSDDSGVKDLADNKNIAADRCKNWMDGRFLQGTFTATRVIDDEKPDVDCAGAGGLSGLRGINKGANVAMCDGSVRFVNVGISLDVWKAIATRAGGEVVPNF